MQLRTSIAVFVAFSWGAALARGQAEKVFLRLEPGGPIGVLNAVAFSPDGDRLYAAGYDKVVRVWARNKDGAFDPSGIAYRVPVGPGLDGTINALAASPDGDWLAVGGLGLMRGRADFRTVGMVFPALGAMTPDMLQDQGTIFVFDVNNQRVVKSLRGHAGPVLALAFLPARPGKPPLLVSAAYEADDKTGGHTAHVRLWDVAAGASLAEEKIDTKLPDRTPGLAAWATGPGPKDVAVAVAWADGKARVWDVAAGKVQEAPDGKADVAAAPAPEGRFLTASFVGAEGAVRSWKAESGQAPQQAGSDVRLAPEDPQKGPFFVPYDMASFPSKANGPIDRAAVLARRQGLRLADDDQDALFLIDLARDRVLGRRLLDPSTVNHRRIAASPAGDAVAVADADRQQVLVFSAADLAAGGGGPKQALHAAGTNFQAVAFRKKGDDPGLLLREDGGANMVFDFNNRRLVPDGADWKDDTLEAAGWKVDMQEGKKGAPGAVTVSGPQFDAKTVLLGEEGLPTAAALLPPRKGGPAAPVLAVGWLDKYRQPMLALYDVASGTQVRQLPGHVAAVHSLAFSADGRLLASAAADQTVCLWTMTNLGEVLGKVGVAPGVAVVWSGKDVVVERAPEGGPLKKDDVVVGVVEGDKVRPLASPREFYTAFFNAKPGSTLVLRVARAGAAPADVRVEVGQGADEHKPLLSLFVTREGDPARRRWIAWTSMGPYDASSPQAEDYLGWHFNPEKPDQPVDFARAEKYRGDYESPGLLKYLVRDADASKAVEEWKHEAPPELEMSIDGVDPQGPRVVDRPLVRTRALTMRLELPRTFPVERVTAVRWRLDDGPWQELGQPQERAWSADLSKPAWGRGPHLVIVRMETDGGRRQVEQTAAFHYLPEPPRIEFAKDWLAKNFPGATGAALAATTKQAAFTVEARVTPGAPGEEVRIAVRRGDDAPTAVLGGDVHQELTLKEGENIIEIRATNAGASKDLEAEETAVRRLVVNYFKERPAPAVTIRAVVPLSEGAAEIPVRPGEAVVASVPKVRVVGRVVGEEDLEDVKREGKTLDGFTAGKAKEFDIKEDLTLKPGEQVVSYQARTKNSPVGEGSVRLVYQPPTPVILSVRPVDQSRLYRQEVELQAELAPADDPRPFTAEVLVNDRRQAKLPLDPGGRSVKAAVTLDPGSNRVVVRLSNEWGASAVRELQLRYLRPPRVVKFEPPAMVDRAVLDLVAEVESPAELPPREAKLNDALFRDDRLQAELVDREKGLWKVTLRDAALQEGDNALTLSVANADDVSREPAAAKVRYTKPKPPAPVVRFRDYKVGEAYNVPAPEVPLAFTVESTTALKRVELRGENDAVLFQAPPGAPKVEHEERIHLRPARPTLFRVVAVNDGGETDAEVTLQLPERPAYVVIDRLESLQPGGQPFVPSGNDAQGRAVFDTVGEGRVGLHGRIFWNDPNDERFRQGIVLRVYANGFQQIPAAAEPPPPGQAECTFSATILLTRAADNFIEVDLPDLKLADGQRSACVVRQCTNPIRGRRLHLVVIGIDEKDGDALKQRALDAVKAKPSPDAEGKWQAPPAFEEVVAYDPLVGGVSKGQVLHRLKGVKRQIQAAAPENEPVVLSEVVLVYYQGREMVTPGGDYLMSDDSQGDEDLDRTAVSCSEIVDLFRDARGVQVVMLDAERLSRPSDPNAADASGAFDGARLGVLHSVWTGGAAPATRLLGLLQEGWSQAGNLGDLAKEIDGLRQRLAPQTRFSFHLPGDLAQLEFGGKPRSAAR